MPHAPISNRYFTRGSSPGGSLTITTEVENYPGYPDGVQGPEMMVHFEKQATRMGADIRYGLATKVDFSGHPLKVWIDEEKLIEADAVIIATGASAKWLLGFGERTAFERIWCQRLCGLRRVLFPGQGGGDHRRGGHGRGGSFVSIQVMYYGAYADPAG